MNQGAGKGDRPRQVDPKIYGDNYDRIFRSKLDEGIIKIQKDLPKKCKEAMSKSTIDCIQKHAKGVVTFEEIKDQRGFETDPQSLLFRKFHAKRP